MNPVFLWTGTAALFFAINVAFVGPVGVILTMALSYITIFFAPVFSVDFFIKHRKILSNLAGCTAIFNIFSLYLICVMPESVISTISDISNQLEINVQISDIYHLNSDSISKESKNIYIMIFSASYIANIFLTSLLYYFVLFYIKLERYCQEKNLISPNGEKIIPLLKIKFFRILFCIGIMLFNILSYPLYLNAPDSNDILAEILSSVLISSSGVGIYFWVIFTIGATATVPVYLTKGKRMAEEEAKIASNPRAETNMGPWGPRIDEEH